MGEGSARGGGGVPLEITVVVNSMLPESKPYLRQKYVIRSPLCQLSSEKHTIFKSFVSERTSLLCFNPERGKKPGSLTVYSF